MTPQFLSIRYDHVEFIDRGAYGRVYKCTRAGVITAVKILDELDSESEARFGREISIIQSLDHPNIVRIFDAGKTGPYHWYESEYANQGHLGPMYGYLFYSDLDRVNYLRQVCLGLPKIPVFCPDQNPAG